tara:strand:+ start:1628 stop:2173 length:546 start_codon:yes stop_codon:yes gene_type:complete
MAYLIYDKNEQHVITQLDSDPDAFLAPGAESCHIVFEQEAVDPETDFLTNYRLNAAGDGVENPYKGLSKAEQLTKFQEDQCKIKAVTSKKHLFEIIKSEVKHKIEGEYSSSSWKVERASELDLINGNTDAMRALAIEKQAIRQRGADVEAELTALDPNVAADAKKIDEMLHNITARIHDGY